MRRIGFFRIEAKNLIFFNNFVQLQEKKKKKLEVKMNFWDFKTRLLPLPRLYFPVSFSLCLSVSLRQCLSLSICLFAFFFYSHTHLFHLCRKHSFLNPNILP